MSLLDLKTDLKSIKYGSDLPGGGDSGLPYITTDINTVDRPFNRLRLTKFDDGLIRGGFVGATNSSIVDALRIGKFFTDLPKGPLFIFKQVGLQLSNPKLEVKKGTTSFFTKEATRIYNLGINTLLQVPLNAFGGHLVRHGILPVQNEDTKYEAVVTANNGNFNLNSSSESNRLVALSKKFQLGDIVVNRSTGTTANSLNQITLAVGALTGISIPQLNRPIDTVIDDYLGGPGSVYGIGKTLIKRSSNTEDGFKVNLANQLSSQLAGKTRGKNGDIEIVKLKNTYSYKLSNYTSSSLAEKKFEDLPKKIENADNSLLGYDVSNNIFPDPSFTPSIKIKDNWSYELSNYTSSSLSERKFEDLPKKIDNPNLPLLNIIANNSDKSNPFKYFTSSSISYNEVQGKGDKAISNYSKDVNNTDTGIDQTSIQAYSKTSPSLRKYADLASQVKLLPDGAIYTHEQYEQDKLTGNIPSLDSGLTYYTNTSDTHYTLTPDNKNLDGSIISVLESIVDKTAQSKVYKAGAKNNPIDTSPKATIIAGNKNNIKAVPASFKYSTGTIYNRNIDKELGEDAMAITFAPIHPFTADEGDISFLGYITNYSEAYESGWNDIRYAGRAESFYVFNSFKKTISLGLNIPCFNQQELLSNHQKLLSVGGGSLAYALAGQYKDNVLGGVLIKLTVGNYLRATPGIITSLGVEILSDSSWDMDYLYAKYLKVTVGFTVIGNQLPEYIKEEAPANPDPVPSVPPKVPSTNGGGGGGNSSTVSNPIILDPTPAAIDHTYVKKPPVYNFKKSRNNRSFGGFGGGSFGGGGAGLPF